MTEDGWQKTEDGKQKTEGTILLCQSVICHLSSIFWNLILKL
jgi:hypothetical protein